MHALYWLTSRPIWHTPRAHVPPTWLVWVPKILLQAHTTVGAPFCFDTQRVEDMLNVLYSYACMHLRTLNNATWQCVPNDADWQGANVLWPRINCSALSLEHTQLLMRCFGVLLHAPWQRHCKCTCDGSGELIRVDCHATRCKHTVPLWWVQQNNMYK